jgi:hypothetical protein
MCLPSSEIQSAQLSILKSTSTGSFTGKGPQTGHGPVPNMCLALGRHSQNGSIPVLTQAIQLLQMAAHNMVTASSCI